MQFPVITYAWYGVIYKQQYTDKNTNIEKIYVGLYASERSERA